MTKDFMKNISYKNMMIVGVVLLLIGIIMLIIGIVTEIIALDILAIVFLLIAAYFFSKAEKKKKQKENETTNNVGATFFSGSSHNNQNNIEIGKININNDFNNLKTSGSDREYSSYKELISNKFDLQDLSSSFLCSLSIMALNQIKQNAYFKPNDLSFDIDERINQIAKLSRHIFLQSNCKNFCSIDLETTGLNTERDKIIQIAIVKVLEGEIVDTYSSYVNPERHISKAASEINNIYDEDVASSKTIKELFPEILSFIQGFPIVAHNAEFDMGFLKNEYFRSFKKELPKFQVKCTMNLWRNQYLEVQGEKVPSAKLQTLVINLLDKQDIQAYLHGQHDAYCDAVATANVFMKIYGNL